MSISLTETLLNFELREKIGDGGEGEVWKALDTQLESIIAIKKVPISSFSDTKEYFNESRKLYITKHHNVVKVNYACKDDDFIYLSMPFYQNGSLKSLTDKRFLTSREIIRYSLQFLSGLNNIHAKKLLHFDIKTENILISDSNQALISDFGLAQYMGHYGFALSCGTTPILAPPEYFAQPKHNVKFDIYQAGLAMLRMCIGDVNFLSQVNSAYIKNGVSDQQNLIDNLIKGKFPNRNYYLPHIPKKLRKIINNALHVDPNERYSSIIDILNDLSKIDNSNDWKHEPINATDSKWTKDESTVDCVFLNNKWEIKSFKKQRAKTLYTKNVALESEKNSLLYDCLNNDW